MDRESQKQMKLDVRLLRRRGWISAEELDRELAALPDASGKAELPAPAPASDD